MAEPETNNIYDWLDAQQPNNEVRTTMGQATKENPDEYARALAITDKRGVDPQMAKRNLSEMERQEQVDQDYEALRTKNPALYKKLTDPNFAAVAHDDMHNLSLVEQATSGYMSYLTSQADVVRSLPAGFAQAFGGAASGAGNAGELFAEKPAMQFYKETFGEDSWQYRNAQWEQKYLNPSKWLKAAGGAIKDVAEFFRPPEERQGYHTMVAEGVGQITGQIMAAMIAPELSVAMLLGQGADQQVESYMAAEAQGAEISDNQKRLAVVFGASVTGITEKYQLDRFMKLLPGPVRKKVQNRLAQAFLDGGAEAVQEIVEGIGHNFVEAGIYNPEAKIFDPGQMTDEGIAAGGAGFISSLILTALPGRANVSLPDKHKEDMDKLREAIMSSKLYERRKASIEELVNEASGDAEVYVPVQDAIELFQTLEGGQQEFENAAQQFGWNEDDIQLGLASNTSLPVPVAKFAMLQSDPAYQKLIEIVRRTPDEQNLREATDQAFKDAVSQQADKLNAQIREENEKIKTSTVVRDTIYTSLSNIGTPDAVAQSTAEIWAAAFDVLESKGVDQEKLFARLGLQVVKGEQADGRTVIDDDGVSYDQATGNVIQNPNFRKWFGDSKVVNEDGSPMVMYHGTPNDVEAFNPVTAETADGRLGKGIYFSPSASSASMIAGVRKTGAPNVMPVYLSMQNPLVIEGGYRNVPYEMDHEVMIANGFDGVIVKDASGAVLETMVFSPNQIKSVNNSGSFSIEDDRILFQSAAGLQSNPLATEATGRGGKPTIWNVASALHQRHMEKYGRPLDPSDEADYKIIVDSLYDDYLNQAEEMDTGHSWYVDEIDAAVEITKGIIPELELADNRDLLLTMAAILSPQQKPGQNWENAVQAMTGFLKTGKIPLLKENGTNYGVGAQKTGLQILQHLIDRHGVGGAIRWLRNPHTGEEIAAVRRETGIFKEKPTLAGYTASETNLKGTYPGIAIMGPKVSNFMQNATGFDPSEVTVDLWLARTYNRMIGRLLDVGPAKEGIDPASELRGKKERDMIKKIVRDVAAKADIDASAMQAALWYFEQRLYANHGIRTESKSFKHAAEAAAQRRGILVPTTSKGSERSGRPATKLEEQAQRQNADNSQTVRRTFAGRKSFRGRVTKPVAVYGDQRQIFEITDHKVFRELISEAQKDLGLIGPQVTVYDDYKNKRLFLFDNGYSGFALDGDDIISVFSVPERAPRGAVKRLMPVATQEGGRRLDAFDTFLPRIYASAGFRAVAKLPFNREYAPDGWQYDFVKKEFPHTNGEPDVMFMVYDPDNANPSTENVVEDYDQGIKAQMVGIASKDGVRVLNQFAGVKSQTADKHALSSAVERLNAGEDAETVRRETGWFRGPDEQWRYEISDHDATLKFSIKGFTGEKRWFVRDQNGEMVARSMGDMSKWLKAFNIKITGREVIDGDPANLGDIILGIEKGTVRLTLSDGSQLTLEATPASPTILTLGEVIDHPRLFAAYPDMQNIPVDIYADRSGQYGYAIHDRTGHQIGINRTIGDAQALSTLLHEAQHVIQQVEGFAEGGNPSKEMQAEIAKAMDKLQKSEKKSLSSWQKKGDRKKVVDTGTDVKMKAAYALMFRDRNTMARIATNPKGEIGDADYKAVRAAGEWAYNSIVFGVPSDPDYADKQTVARWAQNSIGSMLRPGQDGFEDSIKSTALDVMEMLNRSIPEDFKTWFRHDERGIDAIVDELMQINRDFDSQHGQTFTEFTKANERIEQRARMIGWVKMNEPAYVYRALFGEIEARNTQKRQMLTPGERANTKVEDTQDYPTEAAVILIGDKATHTEVRATHMANMDVKRGSVSIPTQGVLSNQDVVVRMYEAADFSTFVHEGAHIFLEIYKELSVDNAEVNKTYQSILQWLGNSGGPLTTEQHEKFASGFETYLAEGVAPSEDLRFAFARFKLWLNRIYHGIKGMKVQLDPEARKIFTNILATEQQVEAAYRAQQFEIAPLMAELMTDEEYARLQKAQDRARTTAKELALKQLMREEERQQSDEYKADKKKFTEEETERLWQQKPYQAWWYLTRGYFKDGETADDVKNLKLNRKAVVDLAGEDVIAKLPRGKRVIYTKDGGLTPDQMAMVLGYDNGAELIRDLTNHPKPQTAIDAAVRARLDQKYGDMKADGKLEEEATKLSYNLNGERFLAIEQKMMARKAGVEPTSLQVLKATAERVIMTQPIRNIMKPGQFNLNSQRAARRALQAAAKGDFNEALRQKELQILNYELSRLAYKARDEVRKRRTRLNKVMQRKYDPKRVDPKYIQHAKKLLGLYYGLSQDPAADVDALNTWAQKLIDENLSAVDLPLLVMQGDVTMNIDQLALEDLRDLDLSVKSILHSGRAESAAAYDEIRKEAEALASGIEGNLPPKKQPKNSRAQPSEGKTMASTLWANVQRVSTILRELDGGEDFGPMFRAIWVGMREGLNAKERMDRTNDKAIDDIFKPIAGDFSRRVQVDLNGKMETWPFEQIMAMAQNMGNLSSKQALYRDFNQRYGMDEAQVDALVFQNLEQRHWDAVQATWDYINTYWDQIVELSTRMDGVAPPKVEALPVETPFGVYPGGYYPLKYTQNPGEKGYEELIAEKSKSINGGSFAREQTPKGMLIARQTSGGREVVLDYRVLTRHLDDVSNMLAMREPVYRAVRILNQKSVRDAISNTMGVETLLALNDIITRAGAGYVEPAKSIDRFVRKLRVGAAMSDLAFNVRSWAVQFLGVTQTINTLGMIPTMRGYARYITNPKGSIKMVFEKSEFMRGRPITRQRDFMEMQRRGRSHGALTKAQEIGMLPLGWIDTISVAVPTWMAAYEAGLDKFDGDQKEAALYADQKVSDTQSAGQLMELTSLQSGSELSKAFTYMWGYFSSTLNLTIDEVRAAKRSVRQAQGVQAKSVALTASGFRLTLTFMNLYLIPAILAGLVLEGLPDDDDDEGMFEWFLWQIANQSAGVLPFLRDLPRSARYAFGSSSTLSSDRLAGTLTDTLKGGFNTVSGKAWEEDDLLIDPLLIKGLARTGGLWFGIPGTNQAVRIIDDLLLDDDPTLYEAIITGKDRDN